MRITYILRSQPSLMEKDCWVLQSGYTQHTGQVQMFRSIETRGGIRICIAPVDLLLFVCVKNWKFSGKFTLLNGYSVNFYNCNLKLNSARRSALCT